MTAEKPRRTKQIDFAIAGSTISCFGADVPGNVLNTYCWIMSTFSVPNNPSGHVAAHPGLGPEGDSETVHAYYQWVPFVLFLQVG